MKKNLLILILSFTMLNFGFGQNCGPGESEVKVVISTDNFAAETSWQLANRTGTIYNSISSNYYENSQLYETVVCVPAEERVIFTIADLVGDGIFAPGYYQLFVDGELLSQGNSFGENATIMFSQRAGASCFSAIPVSTGAFNTEEDDFWYEFTPGISGIYEFSTCGADCDTKVWLYDGCQNLTIHELNEGTLAYSDDTEICGTAAIVSIFLFEGESYIIRIGDSKDRCSNEPIPWEANFRSGVPGCMDPASCNYDPLATEDDGSCLPPGDPGCSGPDLYLDPAILANSLQLTSYNSTDPCTINEGCLKGYGIRNIIRFSTNIANIGTEDYYIGAPDANPEQFTFDNCHNHFHYDGYAEYLLFDESGARLPTGFKNGFCVLDLFCSGGGIAKYSCGNMGISVGCEDEYWSSLQCQWIDVTDVADGTYTFVTRVNWDNAPDALGRYELDTLNNWAQVCITLDRSSGSLQYTADPNCPIFTDCAGIPYGSTGVDCSGTCGGTLLPGDLDADGERLASDVQLYETGILNNTISPTTCNDLNSDGQLTVYDAALLSDCILYTAGHGHEDGSSHDHCNLPGGLLNPDDTVYLQISAVDFLNRTMDIQIKNPSTALVGYQFNISGISATGVTNLVDPAVYPVTPGFNGNGMIYGLSPADATILKSAAYQPLCRISFSDILDPDICLANIVDIVNDRYEQVVKVLEPLQTCFAGCPDTLYIPGQMVWSDYQAGKRIRTDGVVPDGTNISVAAGIEIDLDPGFEVEPGGEFYAYIDDCSFSAARKTIQIIDHPGKTQKVVHFKLLERTRLTAALRDINGSIVNVLLKDSLAKAGNQEIIIDQKLLNPGVYFLTIGWEGFEKVGKIVIPH